MSLLTKIKLVGKKVYVYSRKEKDAFIAAEFLKQAGIHATSILLDDKDSFRNAVDQVNKNRAVIVISDSESIVSLEKSVQNVTRLDNIFEVPFYFFNSQQKSINDVFTHMLTSGRIGVIQFDIIDSCNLNCALCSHFSPLVNSPVVYKLEQLRRDAMRLKELTEHIDCIGLWGEGRRCLTLK